MRFRSRLRSDAPGWLVEFLAPGQSGMSGRSLWLVGRFAITASIIAINLIGAAAALVILGFVIPLPGPNSGHVRFVNAIAAAAYVVLAVPLGAFVGTRGLFSLRQWLIEERSATAREQRIVLRAPLRLFVVQVGLWMGAAALFGGLNAYYYGPSGAPIAIAIVIAGLITATCAYLVTERILRSSAVRAFAAGMPERLAVPGVATRAVLAWALGTGLPVLGLVAIGILQLTGQDRATPSRLAVVMVVIGGIGLAVGLLAVGLAARATADPIDSVRGALGRVRGGDFGVEVPVYDGTQVGQLQLGFNAMAAGLAERERIRETFGTYVDPDVAERILREGTSLEGEDVDVTIMFIDVCNFTGFAEQRAARDVVASINALFERIVPVVHDHDGRVDKFIGDGLLAVFGAPRRLTDHADRALAAALEIERSVDSAGGELRIGIGLNSGSVLAGNVGAPGRLEFSVIGDAVNVAARVEAATRTTGDTILLTQSTRERLREAPAELEERPGVALKGKTEDVRLYVPRQPAARRTRTSAAPASSSG